MKNIMLATDLTSQSDRAFERAIKLTAIMKTKLHILHICPSYSYADQKSRISSLKQDAEDAVKNYLSCYPEAEDIQHSITVIDGGEVFLEIIKHAEKVKSGLIVMGMHGKSRFLDMFIGTTIERVVRKGITPVLMVKNKAVGDYKTILIGTDFLPGSRKAFQIAFELAQGGIFHLFHCYEIPDTAIGDTIRHWHGDMIKKRENEQLEKFVKDHQKFLKKFGVSPENFRYWTAEGAAYSCLTQEAAALKPDLIAIGAHGSAGGFTIDKLGGTAQSILTNPPCDVLVAKSN